MSIPSISQGKTWEVKFARILTFKIECYAFKLPQKCMMSHLIIIWNAKSCPVSVKIHILFFELSSYKWSEIDTLNPKADLITSMIKELIPLWCWQSSIKSAPWSLNNEYPQSNSTYKKQKHHLNNFYGTKQSYISHKSPWVELALKEGLVREGCPGALIPSQNMFFFPMWDLEP